MPIYMWRDNKREGKRVEVVRNFSEYTIPPTKEEAVDWNEEEFSNADWERIMGGGIKVTRPAGYGSKGNW